MLSVCIFSGGGIIISGHVGVHGGKKVEEPTEKPAEETLNVTCVLAGAINLDLGKLLHERTLSLSRGVVHEPELVMGRPVHLL